MEVLVLYWFGMPMLVLRDGKQMQYGIGIVKEKEINRTEYRVQKWSLVWQSG